VFPSFGGVRQGGGGAVIGQRVKMNFFRKLFSGKTKPAECARAESVPAPLLVVAKIVAVEPHPNADRLHVLRVDAGDGELRQIVCGAPNVRPGFVGVLALPGAILPDETEPLSARELRGVLSNGMMCSEGELGQGPGHNGILELPADSKLGKEYKL